MPRRLVPVLVLLLLVVLPAASWAAPVLRSPGYRGVRKPVATQAATAPDPSQLGTGARPDVLVDDAGTAHVVWTDAPNDAPTTTVYCRVPRNARACDVVQRLVPPFPDATAVNDPRFSVDLSGPRVLAVNDQVLVLSHRYPFAVPKPGPDRSRDDDTTYLWTSDDGGRTFTGPAVVSTDSIDGDAIVWGSPDAPQITTTTGLVTGGITATTISAGRFVFAGAQLARGDFTLARLAVQDGRPVVAYQDLGSTTFVRRWTGQGDVNDPGTWDGPVSLPGGDPDPAVAGGRLLVLNEATNTGTLQLSDLTGGGAPMPVNTGRAGNFSELIGYPDGSASVLWQGQESSGASGIWLRPSVRPGTPPRAAPALVTTVSPLFSAAAATADRGGVVVGQDEGRILMAAFGSGTPTGLPGLGSRVGGQPPLAPDVVQECQKVAIGPVQAVIQEGCLFSAARGSAKVTEGEIRLNGLDIVPDAGVQVLIDPRARTIDTTGTVSVLLRAPGIPDITLFRGELHLKLTAPKVGGSLFSFPDSVFKPNVLGFPVSGDIDVKLTPGGVRIPIRLQLPPALGGVSGGIELVASNERGLSIDSLDLEASAVPLGPVMLRNLKVQYRASGGTSVGDCLRPPTSGASAQPNEWAGVFELELPPPGAGPKLCGSIRFGDGAFRAATFRIDLPYPGIVLFPGVSITSLGGGLSLDPLEVSATVTIGIIPATAQAALVNVDGSMTLRLDPPVAVRGQVAVRVADLRVGDGTFLVSAEGYVNMSLRAGYSIGPFSVNASINGFVDGPREAFSVTGRGDICVEGTCFGGGQVVVSTTGVALCGPVGMVPRGGGYRWGTSRITDVDVWLVDCDADDYEVGDTRAAQAVEHAGVQDGTFSVEGRPTSVTVRVRGDGGVPRVDLTGPAGPVTPAETFADAASGTLYLGLRAPPEGGYRVTVQPGSPAIAELATARSVAPARVVSARVQGRGSRRTLVYRARVGEGQGITFAERGAAGTRVIGAARNGAGRLAFAPAAGPGGARTIVALVAQNDLVRGEATVARYTAPRPPALRAPSGLRVRRTRAGAVATWRPAQGAAGQLALVRRGTGREVRLLGRGARRLVVTGVLPATRVAVEVRTLAADGRRSAPARAVAAGRR